MLELTVENDFMLERDFYSDERSIVQESIPNPQHLLDRAISVVLNAMRKLKIMFGMDWQDFEVFLRTIEPDLDLTIDELWRRVDCDVYCRYLNGELCWDNFKKWSKELKTWQDAMIEAIQKIEDWKRKNTSSDWSIKRFDLNLVGKNEFHHNELEFNVMEEVLL